MTPQFKNAASWEIHFEKSMSFRVFVGATQKSNIFVVLPFYLKEMVQHQYFQEMKVFHPNFKTQIANICGKLWGQVAAGGGRVAG